MTAVLVIKIPHQFVQSLRQCEAAESHSVFAYHPAPDRGARSIVMSVSVCVCLSACVCLYAIISPELHVRSLPDFYARYLWPWLGPPLAA